MFNIKIGKAIDGNKVDKISGHYPYITRKESNNGLDGFIDYDETFLNVEFPVITVGNETAQPYVQNFPFFTGTKVNILSPKKSLSRFTLMFIAQSLRVHKEKYSYSFTINSTRLQKQKIMLPVTDDDTPDYEYMENYIRAVEERILQRYREFISICPPPMKISPLKEKVWRAFFIGEIFDVIQRGKRLKTADHVQGDKPYVSSSAQNNGVDSFIGNDKNVRTFEDCLTIANSGSVGKTFYHEYEFIASDHVTALSSPRLNKYHYLFLAAQLNKLSERYSFNREITDARIRREKLMLPVNDAGEPDFEYMEAFIKSKMAAQYRRYLNYIDGE